MTPIQGQAMSQEQLPAKIIASKIVASILLFGCGGLTRRWSRRAPRAEFSGYLPVYHHSSSSPSANAARGSAPVR